MATVLRRAPEYGNRRLQVRVGLLQAYFWSTAMLGGYCECKCRAVRNRSCRQCRDLQEVSLALQRDHDVAFRIQVQRPTFSGSLPVSSKGSESRPHLGGPSFAARWNAALQQSPPTLNSCLAQGVPAAHSTLSGRRAHTPGRRSRRRWRSTAPAPS